MSLRTQQKETAAIMNMVQEAQRSRALETELTLLRDILSKVVARLDEALANGSEPDDSAPGLSKSVRVPMTEAQYWEIVDQYRDKQYSVPQIASNVGRHLTTVRNVLIREGVYKAKKRKGKR